MGLISPQELNDDPKLWLSVPHELHESVGKLMEILFPGFAEKLTNIHCLECDGKKPFEVITKDTFEIKLCTGYIEEGDETLLRLEGGD